MAQTSAFIHEPISDNSTKEFLRNEKDCECFKDSDEEIKNILNELNSLSVEKHRDVTENTDGDDVELILRKAEMIAEETQQILKNTPAYALAYECIVTTVNSNDNIKENAEIISSKPEDNVQHAEKKIEAKSNKTHQAPKHSSNTRRKSKVRPFSAGVLENRKKEPPKPPRLVPDSPKKNHKQEHLIEELKDTSERAKSLEFTNVRLVSDNKALRKRLEEIGEEKHITALKLAECEKFISKLGKELESRNNELKLVHERESKISAELTKERNERKNLKLQHDKDVIVVNDLQRQCKEMEMILKRKHPDSVSALIAKSSSLEDNKKKFLEERIARLEQELKDKEDHFQNVLQTLQQKFTDMKQKYESHIIDVERQLMDDRKVSAEMKTKLTKSNLTDTAVQTSKYQHNAGTQTFIKPSERSASAVSRLTQNSALLLTKLKEDSYLVATIKGLQAELTVKQRAIAKINRETEDLRKSLRNLQKDKELLMNLNPQIQRKIVYKQNKSADNLLMRANSEMEAELLDARKQKESIMQERNSLLESLKRSNEEFILLKKKRIQDLHTLQLAHEKELMQMNMQVYPLQEEIKLLNRTVDVLQDRLKSTEEQLARYKGGKSIDVNAGGDNGITNGSPNKNKFKNGR